MAKQTFLTQEEANLICLAVKETLDLMPEHAPGDGERYVRDRLAAVDAGVFGEDAVERWLAERDRKAQRKRVEIIPEDRHHEWRKAKLAFYEKMETGGL
jgi:hypothetical protein